MAERQLTQEYVRSLFEYDPETGVLTWKERPIEHFKNSRARNIWNARYAWKAAGSTTGTTGYRAVKIGDRLHQAHRVVWLWIYGVTPCQVDHVNGVRADNRLCNLRNTDATGNTRNHPIRRTNSSGTTGVSWSKRDGRWRAYIGLSGKESHLGNFATIEEAIEARAAANKRFGFHANHGRAAK